MNFATIEDVTEFILDGTHASPERTETGIPVLSAQNVRDGELNYETTRFTSQREYEAFRRRLSLKRGDVLLTIVGTIGRAAVLNEIQPLVFQRSVAVLRPREDRLHPRFMYHVIKSRSFKSQLIRASNQSSQAGVYLGKLKKLRIPLLPLPEQRRIAEMLDEAETVRAKRLNAILQLTQIAQSIFVEMFGDPTTNPRGWPEVPLGRHASKIGSGATPLGGEAAYKHTGIALIRSMNVRDGRFSTDGLAYIDDTQAARLEGVVVNSDDVLLNITGASVARVCRAPSNVLPARVNQHVAIIRPTRGFDPRFLEQCLLFPSMKRRLLRIAGAGATREAITKDALERLSLIQPPRAEQVRFAEAVGIRERLETAQRSHLTLIDSLSSSLRNQAFDDKG